MIRQLRNEPNPEQRLPRDYKELIRIISNMHFFHKPMNDHTYTEEEAIELMRYAKVRYVSPGEHIYMPGETNAECFFILRGKVLVGVKQD